MIDAYIKNRLGVLLGWVSCETIIFSVCVRVLYINFHMAVWYDVLRVVKITLAQIYGQVDSFRLF